VAAGGALRDKRLNVTGDVRALPRRLEELVKT
jgi:hypothetical protein